MLVTFKTPAWSDITMFGEVAEHLLKLMGQSGNVPGAIVHADIDAALQRLQENLVRTENQPAPGTSDDAGAATDEGDLPVSAATRAQPLIQLLEAANAAGDDVIWEN